MSLNKTIEALEALGILKRIKNIENIFLKETKPTGGIGGGVLRNRVKSTETSTGTATMSDSKEIHFCNSSSAYVLTLPTQVNGKQIRIINKNTGTVTLTPASGTIGGETTQQLLQNEVFVATSDGTNWY